MNQWQIILDAYIRYMQAVNRGGGRKRQFDNSKSDKDNKKEQKNGNANGHKQKGEAIKARDKKKGADDEFEENDEFTEPQEKKKRNEPSTSKSSAGSSKPSTSKATSNSPKKSSAKGKKKDGDDDRPNDASGATQTQSKNIDEDREIEIVTCQPSDRAKVVLIADSREHRNYGFYAKSVVEHIAKSGFEFDVRSMPVGDYMWLARKEDGTEMVLDWVVERKTWDDLQSSIIGGRYLEQKGRLLKSPMRSRVYLIEGNEKSEESPCHQALMTTLINHGFLVHRSPSMRDTSKFLERITLRLINAVQTEDLSGVDFRDLQTLVEKPQAETVSEAWMTQLMCFRGMSESRATALVRRFPTFVALRRFIDSSSNPVKHLLKEVESLNEPTANRIVSFFKTKPE
ncbi:hypothetical protein WR25_18598 isoform C [Diploscapter pachys]|uniref:Crossover junction endonuclease MUS81 n=1 Tax=Diploscapter pachys TaxID=2018661 RepID=A0A2A2LN32_9BILA|nr:hypothetical protein WR25_18598 isoform C [Diploscapter pachys]